MNFESSHPTKVGAEKLLRMAREIADYFKSYPDERAIAGIADHINHFWTPKMREEFLAASAAPEHRLPPRLMAARERIRRKKAE